MEVGWFITVHKTHSVNIVHLLFPDVLDKKFYLLLCILHNQQWVVEWVSIPFILKIRTVNNTLRGITRVDMWFITRMRRFEGLSVQVGNPFTYPIVSSRDEAALLKSSVCTINNFDSNTFQQWGRGQGAITYTIVIIHPSTPDPQYLSHGPWMVGPRSMLRFSSQFSSCTPC